MGGGGKVENLAGGARGGRWRSEDQIRWGRIKMMMMTTAKLADTGSWQLTSVLRVEVSTRCGLF